MAAGHTHNGTEPRHTRPAHLAVVDTVQILLWSGRGRWHRSPQCQPPGYCVVDVGVEGHEHDHLVRQQLIDRINCAKRRHEFFLHRRDVVFCVEIDLPGL